MILNIAFITHKKKKKGLDVSLSATFIIILIMNTHTNSFITFETHLFTHFCDIIGSISYIQAEYGLKRCINEVKRSIL